MTELLGNEDNPGWDVALERELEAAPEHAARVAAAARYVGDAWAEEFVAHFEGTFEPDCLILEPGELDPVDVRWMLRAVIGAEAAAAMPRRDLPKTQAEFDAFVSSLNGSVAVGQASR